MELIESTATTDQNEPARVECAGRTVREINREIRGLIAAGCREIHLLEPGAQHNLGVGIVEPVRLSIEGSVGYYCGGMCDGPAITIRGSAGWGAAEGLMGGTIVVEGHAGNGAGAAMRGGTVVVKGDAGARAGVSIKGGTLVIGGDCGYMTGFMGQKGTIIVCGNADEALGDSMYATVLYVGGRITDLGSDAVLEPLDQTDQQLLATTLRAFDMDVARDWKKVVSGRKLWTFDKHETLWQTIL
jgi:glutamate synthase domain-containing protein 3